MFLFELMNLGEGFKKYFEIAPALTDELRDHVYRIRHEVYCAELKYEPVRADKRERDDYDAHAPLLARPGDPLYPLPVEKTCPAPSIARLSIR